MNKQKALEKHQFIKFISNEKLKLRVYGLKDSETPDFILKFEDKTVTVELTQLIFSKKQIVEQFKDEIIRVAQKRFTEKYKEKLYVTICFEKHAIKSKGIGAKEKQKVIDEVFSFVEKIYLSNKNYEFEINSKFNSRVESDIIESFTINNSFKFNHWQHHHGFLVEDLEDEVFQKVIKKKEDNIIKYHTNCDEDWLLIVSDLGTEASTHCLSGIDYSKIDTQFDKVFLYSYMPDIVEVIK